VDVRRDDRRSGGHRLQQDDAERFATGGRRREDIGRPEQLGLLGIGDPAEEFDRLQAACRHVAARLALLRSRADDQKPVAVAGLAEDAMCLQQVKQPLARLVPAHEEDVGGAVLPARQRDRASEGRDVDAVRDDLVVAREEAVDEVARRGTDGDAAVQSSGMAAHHPAAQFVGRGEAGVGMEGGDIDTARFAQQEEGQEGHERLVEVEDIKALAGQQRPDLADVPRRERDRSDGAVGRHAEADADPQDVALGGALRAVARRDDPDVVAARPQVGVQELDMLRHAARFRVDVRTDQADLHRDPSSPAA